MIGRTAAATTKIRMRPINIYSTFFILVILYFFNKLRTNKLVSTNNFLLTLYLNIKTFHKAGGIGMVFFAIRQLVEGTFRSKGRLAYQLLKLRDGSLLSNF